MTTDALADEARAIQQRIERFYALEAGPDVADFVQSAEPGEREQVVVRPREDALELAVVLPAAEPEPATLDRRLQVIEGVSHFVYLAERARIELPATELELELQAEVDKFVLLAFDGAAAFRDHSRAVHQSLYEEVRYLHEAESPLGHRYRTANRLAARFVRRLADRASSAAQRAALQRFYRAGQADKIRLANAA